MNERIQKIIDHIIKRYDIDEIELRDHIDFIINGRPPISDKMIINIIISMIDDIED